MRQEVVMTTNDTQRGKKSRANNHTDTRDRRGIERRQHESKGFIYMSVVGWVCRRDKERRGNTEKGTFS